MNSKINYHQYLLSETAIIFYFVVIKIIIHLILPEYGFHRDEYYYIDISKGFSFSNLDMLPLTPLYLKLIALFFGYSIKSLHFASALCGALSLAISMLIAKELGGKKYALFLTGLFVLFSGFLIFGAIFTYDSLDFLLWTTAIYFLVKIFREGNPKLWILLGIILGLGLLNKLTILFLGFALFISLWFVPQRKYYKEKWIWISSAIALSFSTPFILWQTTQKWYFLDFAATYAGGISYITSFPEFVWQQLLPNNLFNFPVWITGLYLLLFSKQWKNYRFFGLIYLTLFFLLYSVGAKFYFLIPIYTILIAVGSIKIEEYFQKMNTEKLKTKMLRITLPFAYVLLSLPLLPMVVPVLPIKQFVTYAQVIGVDAGVRTENQYITQLPQHVADRFGWEELATDVAHIYNNLPQNERARTGIFTTNWGQASALNYYQKKHHIPSATTSNGWYYFETLRMNEIKDTYICVGFPPDALKNIFADVQQKMIFTHPYCIPHENNKPICVCRFPRYDLRQVWRVERRTDPDFMNLVNTEGVAAAIRYFYQAREKDPSILMFSERQMNTLGYEYLFNGRIKEAIQLFKLNVDIYPGSFNVYDSLAEGYMIDEQYELAILFYQKSLELNPGNSNATEKLAEIKKLTSQNRTNQ